MNNRLKRALRSVKRERPLLYQLYWIARKASQSSLSTEEVASAIAIMSNTPTPIRYKWHKRNNGWK
ncbi:hypothetical protein LOX61_01450 [Latilactobacillus curvatus]|uniref:hypothetical protein n=1 Tax=Latilactobacillus curvatus TaxID=28038 RepID=UPI0020C7CBB0|nr:hypothetical protein [Latilactobacillus curvatus]MCP8849168.1 hypothetical protein [Latilactobacillus curvatus]